MILTPSLFESTSTWVTAVIFVLAGLSALPGCLHLIYIADSRVLMTFDIWPWLTGGALYILGAIVYAKRWPECIANGKFDYLGNSHNIFHVCILLAALMHWYGSVRVFHERQMYACPTAAHWLTAYLMPKNFKVKLVRKGSGATSTPPSILAHCIDCSNSLYCHRHKASTCTDNCQELVVTLDFDWIKQRDYASDVDNDLKEINWVFEHRGPWEHYQEFYQAESPKQETV